MLTLPRWLGSGPAGAETQSPPTAGRPLAGRVASYDQTLLWVVAALLLIGLVMVYSASIALPDSARFARLKTTHYLERQAIAILVGCLAGVATASIPLRVWQRLAPWLFVAGLVLLLLVFVPGVGKSALGARRWVSLAGFSLQPSELMKVFVILYAADYAVRKQACIHRFREGFLPMAVALLVIGAMLLLQKDLGACIVIVGIALLMLFLGGVRVGPFIAMAVTLLVAFALIIWASPWRWARVIAYLDPFEPGNAKGKAYQLTHSLIAFGRGEWFGVGLGGSVEKWHYLPEAHTDFLLAVIGEELGLVGVLVVILLFFWLIRRAFEIGRQALALERFFNGLLAQGIGLWIGIQASINMGVNLGLLPTKGLTLPFMSYGGSGIVVNMLGVALLMRVDLENRRLMRGAA